MRSLPLCLALSLALTAFAQDPGDQPSGRGPGGPGGPGGRGAWVNQMFDRVTFELSLDEQQQATLASLREQMREQMRERMQGMRERWQEIRSLQEAGDEEKARQLREELRSRGSPWDAMDEVFDQLEPSLRPEQVGRLDDLRDRVQTQREGWERSETLVRDLPNTLQLDDGQKEQFRGLVRERMRGGWEERRSQMEALNEEIAAARAAGDSEKLAALYAQQDELRPNPDRNLQEFFTQLEPLLNDQQKQQLAQVREESFGAAAADAPAGGGPDLKTLLRAARRARLTPEQRSELRSIEREANRAWRGARSDEAARAQVVQQVKAQVEQLLTAEQKPVFEQQLERGLRRSAK